MKTNNAFDNKLKAWEGRMPNDVHEAAVFVNDTLELSWASAQSIFDKDATPEHALAIYDRLVARAKSNG